MLCWKPDSDTIFIYIRGSSTLYFYSLSFNSLTTEKTKRLYIYIYIYITTIEVHEQKKNLMQKILIKKQY
jgi:hypothetical protein